MNLLVMSGAGVAGRGLVSKALAVLCACGLALAALPAAAQGRPDVRWSEAGHAATVTSVVRSPDGSLLATASDDRTVKLWRASDGTLLRTLAVPYAIDAFVTGIPRVRFTPDGAYVAAAVAQYDSPGNRDFGAVHVFRVSDGAHLRVLARQAQGIAALDVSPDGAWIATAGPSAGVVLWRFADGTRVKTLRQHPGGASEVRFSPDGKRLAAGFDDFHLVAWKTKDGSLQWDVPAHDGTIACLEFAPDGTQVATASLDGTARLFDAATGALGHTLATGSGLRSVVFTADGASLATAGGDGVIRLWDRAQGTLIRQFAGTEGSLAALAWASDGKTLVSGGDYPSRLLQWNPADGRELAPLSRLASGVSRVTFSPDGESIAIAASFDQRVDVFRTRSGKRTHSWDTHVTQTDDVAFSPTGGLIALPGADHTVVIRRLSDGKTVRTLVGHDEDVVGLAFSHDGTLLASGSFFPGSIRLWRTSDWSLVRVIQGSIDLGAFGPFLSLTFTPDDALLGSVAEGAPLVVRVADGGVVAHPDGLSHSATFSPDGLLFAISGGVDGSDVLVYRTSDWALTAALSPGATDVRFTPDGRRLLAAQADGLRFWRTSDWKPGRSYDEELGYDGGGFGVQAVALSPDGALLAYGRDDATLVVANNGRPRVRAP
jgi:WD40 repeat protein